MIDLLALCAFNAAYADAIDSDALEQWPDFFAADGQYRITHIENEREGLPAGIVYADSRAMLEDRIAALLETKRELAATVIGSGEGWIAELSDVELAELVSLRAAP